MQAAAPPAAILARFQHDAEVVVEPALLRDAECLGFIPHFQLPVLRQPAPFRTYYLRDAFATARNTRAYRQRNTRRMRDYVAQLQAGGACADCAQNPGNLEFDHVPGGAEKITSLLLGRVDGAVFSPSQP